MIVPNSVSFLILGAGWTSTFLIPLLKDRKISHAATTTTGRDDTIEFRFEPDSSNPSPYKALPAAATILITFPLRSEGQSRHLTSLYNQTHPDTKTQYIQLGSTGIWQIEGQPQWIDRHSKYDRANARAIAEDELRDLGGAVLNLAGLWGGSRQPRNWVGRVAGSKEALSKKGSLHMIHGQDVARAVLALSENFTPGQRWVSSQPSYSRSVCGRRGSTDRL